MKIAILESIVMPAGHEVEFDRILVEELKKQGHEPVFFVPEAFPFKIDYHTPVTYLDGGEAISYAGQGKLKKYGYLSCVNGGVLPGMTVPVKKQLRGCVMLSSCRPTAGGQCALSGKVRLNIVQFRFYSCFTVLCRLIVPVLSMGLKA